jgi:hypothetical protein
MLRTGFATMMAGDRSRNKCERTRERLVKVMIQIDFGTVGGNRTDFVAGSCDSMAAYTQAVSAFCAYRMFQAEAVRDLSQDAADRGILYGVSEFVALSTA